MKKVGDRRIMTQEGEGKWSTCCKLREYQKPLDNISMCPAADFRKATYIKVFFARYLTHPASLAMKKYFTECLEYGKKPKVKSDVFNDIGQSQTVH